jgi:hypothetical protein
MDFNNSSREGIIEKRDKFQLINIFPWMRKIRIAESINCIRQYSFSYFPSIYQGGSATLRKEGVWILAEVAPPVDDSGTLLYL